MKQLKFEHKYATAIKSQLKTATFRVNDDKDLRVGDEIELVDKVDSDHPVSWQIPGILEITELSSVSFSDLGNKHLARGEEFGSKDEMLRTFRRYYGEHIQEDTPILVVSFAYHAYAEPKKFLNNFDGNGISGLRTAKIYADGGSRGNPGPSAAGYVIKNADGGLVHNDSKYLGITTNNQAEYHALILALEWCLKHNVLDIEIFLDSMLVVNQIKGIFKVKNRDLYTLYETAKTLIGKFRSYKITHIPRELNKLADAEVNKALDAIKGSDVVQ